MRRQYGEILNSVLDTDRYRMRLPVANDFELYRSFFSDAEASKFYGGPLRDEQAWRVLAGHVGHWQLRGYGIWIVERKEDGRVIGGCGFAWPEGWPRRELTWWLLPEARGAGAATEVSRAAISHAYGDYGWDLVETHMDDRNIGARALVERLGGKIIAREMFPDQRKRNIYRLPNLPTEE